MGWYPCPECCRRACPRWRDLFNRADSSDLGPDWEEVSGDWSIGSNALNEAGYAGALAIARAQPQGEKISFDITVTIVKPTPGAQARVIVNWRDAANYFYAQWYYQASPAKFILSLHRVHDATTTLLASRTMETHPEDPTITVCFSDDIFYAVETYGVWTDPESHVGGYRAGLGSGAAVALDFDDFIFSESKATNPACPECGCSCEGHYCPRTLHLVITVASGDYLCLNGIEFDIPWVESPESDFRWQYLRDAMPTCTNCPPWNDTFFDLRCSSRLEHWRLSIETRRTEGSGDIYSLAPDAGSDCDPFHLVFHVDYGPCTQEGQGSRIVYTVTE